MSAEEERGVEQDLIYIGLCLLAVLMFKDSLTRAGRYLSVTL